MDDSSIREKLRRGMAEPSAPEPLVRRTIVRISAVREGLRAEEALEKSGSTLSPEERLSLAARSVAGRLMQTVAPPDGVTVGAMTKQLEEMPAFRKLAELPPEQLLTDLRLGRVNRLLSAAGNAPQRTPTLRQDAPSPRKKGGPQL